MRRKMFYRSLNHLQIVLGRCETIAGTRSTRGGTFPVHSRDPCRASAYPDDDQGLVVVLVGTRGEHPDVLKDEIADSIRRCCVLTYQSGCKTIFAVFFATGVPRFRNPVGGKHEEVTG